MPLDWLLLFPNGLCAQLSPTAVNGTVAHTSGAVIPGAQVYVQGISTGTKRSALCIPMADLEDNDENLRVQARL